MFRERERIEANVRPLPVVLEKPLSICFRSNDAHSSSGATTALSERASEVKTRIGNHDLLQWAMVRTLCDVRVVALSAVCDIFLLTPAFASRVYSFIRSATAKLIFICGRPTSKRF